MTFELDGKDWANPPELGATVAFGRTHDFFGRKIDRTTPPRGAAG